MTAAPTSERAPTLSRDVLRAMPKIELHCHLDGSLRPETMLEIADATGVELPERTPDALRRYMRADNVSSLEDYIARFEATISVLQTADAIERAAYELVADAHDDGVRYIEVRNAPHLNIREGLSLDDVMEATVHGLARGEAATGTVARFIVCSLRNWSPDVSVEAAQLAVRWADRGVVAFDLAGGEAGHPAAAHADAFRYAREHFLGVTCHAGEGDGPDSVVQALVDCGANRIGHGVRSFEYPALLAYLRDRRIPLELCPTSNVQTHAVPSLGEPPIKQYLDEGVTVTVNTDNRLISGITLTDEFEHLVREVGFTGSDLVQCVLNGCRAAFLPLPEREKLTARVTDELARFLAHLTPPTA
jgi:adenosine deaminase